MLVLSANMGENASRMVVRKPPAVQSSPREALVKRPPLVQGPAAGVPEVPPTGIGPSGTADPSASAFSTGQLPRAPVASAPPPPVVARENPFGPQFFAELEEPPPLADPPTRGALDDPLFNKSPADPLFASDVTRLLGYLRQV